MVADAGSARIIALEGSRRDQTPAVEASFENPAARGHARDLGSDRPGRTFESVGSMRHAEEPRTDPLRHAKAAFARTIAEYLEHAGNEKKFDQIVLVAPPAMLGDLRAMLGKQFARRVAGEIGKDLTKLPVAEVMAHLHAAIRL